MAIIVGVPYHDTICGKTKRVIMYYAQGSSELADKNACYTHAMPGAIVLSSPDVAGVP